MQQKEIAAIAELPSSKNRAEALAKTGLVRKWEQGDWRDGLCIESGAIVSSGPQWNTPFPFELVEASKKHTKFATEVSSVFLGQNRIILQGNLGKSLAFLKNQSSDATRQIKRLDVQFNEKDSIEYWEDGPRDSWKQISEFIANELDLDELELSLDASPTYDTYVEMGATETELDFLPDVYREIVNILAEALDGRRPNSFSIYWGAFFNMEAEGEKQIMGQVYDSSALGKIPHTRRASYFPHGAPIESLEQPKGMRL